MPKSKLKLKKILKNQNPQQLSYAIIETIHKFFVGNNSIKVSNNEDFQQANDKIKFSLQQLKKLGLDQAAEDTLNVVTNNISGCCKEVASLLSKNMGEKEILILEEQISHIIEYLLLEFNNLVTHFILAGNSEQKKFAKLIQISLLDIILFLDKNCQILNNNYKLIVRNWQADVESSYFGLANLCVDLDELNEAKKYLKHCKQAINALADHFAQKKSTYWQGYYFVKAKIALKEDDLFVVKKNVLIAQSEIEKEISSLPVNSRHLDFCKDLMLKAWLDENYSEAMFWAKVLKFGWNKNFEIYSKWSYDGIPAGLTFSTNIEKNIIESTTQIKYAKNFIFKIKQKTFSIRLLQLQTLTTEKAAFVAKSNNTENKKDYSVVVNIFNNHGKKLYKFLRLNEIVCSYHENMIIISNLVYVDIQKIKCSLAEWHKYLQRKVVGTKKDQQNLPIQKNDTDNQTQEAADVIGSLINSSVSEKDSHVELSLAIRTQAKIRSPKEPETANNINVQMTSVSEVTTSKPKLLIKWADNLPIYDEKSPKGNVYKIYGLALNHYCFIQPALFEDVCDNNPKAAQDLLNMCENAKAIGNSQHAKGFIIKPNGISEHKKTFDAKIKNSSKDYRFFGHIVSSVETNNGKTCQLLAIDSWQETHKSPVKSIK